MALQAKVTNEELSKLKGKTIIITGGASGIGKSAAQLAHGEYLAANPHGQSSCLSGSHSFKWVTAAGANIVIADLHEEAKDLNSEFKEYAMDGPFTKITIHSFSHFCFHGEEKENSLERANRDFHRRMLYVKADVSSWVEIRNLFAKAWDYFGSLDVVLANAGTHYYETILDHQVDENGDLQAPNLKSLEVNLHSAAYCANAALYYFAKQPEKRCQLVFTGSVARYGYRALRSRPLAAQY